MFGFPKYRTSLLLLAVFAVGASQAQIYNTEIEASINMEANNEFIEITGSAYNKTEISQSVRYMLSVIKTNPENSNRSKNDQSGRIVLDPGEKANLSTTTINANNRDRIIILLLVYDVDDNIVGKDRVVINDDGTADKTITVEATPNKKMAVDVDTGAADGVSLRGIVVEDTKTRPGRDFYNRFYTSYSSNNINGEKIVTIKEDLAIGNNTKIEVLVGDEKVFEFFVRPQGDYLKSMTDVAIRRVYLHLQKLKREKDIIKRY